MPNVKNDWVRTPNAIVWDTLSSETIGPVSVAASAVTTAAVGVVAIPSTIKILKVGVSFGAVGVALASTLAFNVVYNTNPIPTSTFAAYLGNGVVPNDNSNTGGVLAGQPYGPNPANTALSPQTGGLGQPTNYAVDNQPVFAADVTFTTANFPGATTAGGIAYFVPTNPDAVYPCGGSPVVGQNGYIYPNGYFTLRAASPASGTIANVSVTLFYVSMVGKEKWGSPTNSNSFPVPGTSLVPGDY